MALGPDDPATLLMRLFALLELLLPPPSMLFAADFACPMYTFFDCGSDAGAPCCELGPDCCFSLAANSSRDPGVFSS